MGSSPSNSPSGDYEPLREVSTPDPEILSPDGNFAPPAELVRKPRPSWSYAPATYVLLGINCLVFLAMTVRGVNPMSPTTEQLMRWGADNAGNVLLGGEWWRIVTAMFVHVGILHLATNMWCLWNLGLLAEPLMGSTGVLAVYILTGAAGNLLSTCVNWLRPLFVHWLWLLIHWFWPLREVAASGVFPVGAGASGAVFGIAGALIILLKSQRLPVAPLELHKLRRSVIYFAAINLVIGFSISFGTSIIGSGLQIDNMAHLGGFTCGLLFAAPMVPRIGSPRDLFLFRLRVAVSMVVGILVLFGFYLAKLPG
jgi:rhomboid protease GluP